MADTDEKLIWKILSEETVLTTPIMTLRSQQCRAPEGREQKFYILRTRDWCNVIPITEDGKIVLVRQYRQGSGKVSLEIPGGVADPEDKDLEAAAVREMEEETGYTLMPGARRQYLGWTYSNPAILDNRVHSFIAGPVRRSKTQHLDSGELIDVVELPLSEVAEAIRDGRINHALIVNAFFKLLIRMGKVDDRLTIELSKFRE